MARLARSAAASERFRTYARYAYTSRVLDELDRWFRVHFVYRGENEEVIRTPEFMLDTLEKFGYFDGDCDDVSTLYAAFLKALGFPSRFVAIRYQQSNPEFSHVFVETFNGQDWIPRDPTVPEGTVYHEIERMVLPV